MANTYTLISSNVLGSNAASVTFSSIPQTYTDLVLRLSTRNSTGGSNQINELDFNGTTTNYSQTLVQGSGSAVSSTRYTTQNYFRLEYSDSAGNTANTFGSGEIYIPSYTLSSNKTASVFQISEDNSSTAYITAHALLWRNTSAITSLVIRGNNFSGGGLLLAGSSFYLYGIKNS